MEFPSFVPPLRRGPLVALAAALLVALLCPGGAGAQKKKDKVAAAAAQAAQQQVQQQQQQQAEEQAAAQREKELEASNIHAQQVQALIKRAENSYASGVANYNASRLDAARMDFDNAVDVMLASGMDLKGDPALSDEFDNLVDRINSLELVALKQGNGFSPKVEPAPLDAAIAEATFPPDPALVGRLSAELKTTQSDLPLVVNDYVAGFINYFSNSPAGHAHLKASLERAGKYKEMISKTLHDYGVPQDLIYQAVAESGFQPQALNRSSGAGGMWQFMPFAGAYGLERNGYFDERFDPQKSTVAYAKYMKFLYAQFGDWYLAMAAYDWGAGNVQRAVAKTGYADFWELYRHNALPGETKKYVPGILAAVIMAKNPKQYGLTDLVPDAAVVSDTVTTEYAISVPLVADLTNSTVQEIVTLNPALLRLSTPKDIPYDLHLPPGTKQEYLERLKDIPEESRASWRFHVVKDGETLEAIASSLHAHATEIASVNDLKAADPVQAGDELVVPVSSGGGAAGQRTYRARHGDTLVTVADRFGVSVESLRSWNHLSSNRLTPGRALLVAEPVRLAPAGRGARAKRALHVASGKRPSAKTPSAKTHAAVHGKSVASVKPPSHAAPANKRVASTANKSGHTHHGR